MQKPYAIGNTDVRRARKIEGALDKMDGVEKQSLIQRQQSESRF